MENRFDLHKKHLWDILKILYESNFANILWFKWGTALYFFYGLPRYSVDLDFSLTRDLNTQQLKNFKAELGEYLTDKLQDSKYTVKPDGTMTHSIRYTIQYWWSKKIKLEIWSKMYDDNYEIKKILGLDMLVMKIDYMMAHKLCAFVSRYKLNWSIANRDLFDIWFLLKHAYTPHEGTIRARSKKMLGQEMTSKKYYAYLLDFLSKHKNALHKNILNWLWDLMDPALKSWVKNSLVNELMVELQLRM